MQESRPLPPAHAEDREHLDGAARGELRIPYCRGCDVRFWPAGPVCPRDFSPDLAWATDPGRGTVTSWVRFHKRYYAGDEVPYVVVQVRLDSGPRLTTSWSGADDPITGAPVQVSFRHAGADVYLPEFGPAAPPAHDWSRRPSCLIPS